MKFWDHNYKDKMINDWSDVLLLIFIGFSVGLPILIFTGVIH